MLSGEIAYISALLLPANLVEGKQCFQSCLSVYLFTVGSFVIIIDRTRRRTVDRGWLRNNQCLFT